MRGMEGLASRLLVEVLRIDSLNKVVPKSSTRQRSLRTLAEHFMAQLPPGASHAELKRRVTGEQRADLIEAD